MSRDLSYIDPLDQIWLSCAERLGMEVVRSDEVFASWDGERVLTISTPEGFDPDDSLAQMIFHELCHALVEGEAGLQRPDWGLENIDSRDIVREHACHRLQASLLQPHGLRWMLAPTTDHRPYYDGLPNDPLSDGDDPAIAPAREGYARAMGGPWAAPIAAALEATARIAAIMRPFAGQTLWGAVEGS